jgi:hypothetical protein
MCVMPLASSGPFCDVLIIFPVCVRYVAVMEGGARGGGDVAGPSCDRV